MGKKPPAMPTLVSHAAAPAASGTVLTADIRNLPFLLLAALQTLQQHCHPGIDIVRRSLELPQQIVDCKDRQ